MSILRMVVSRFRNAFARRERAGLEMDEEMRLHVALLTEQNRAAGMPATEARRRALLRFGSPDSLAESCRDERRGAWLADLILDIGYGVRMLRRSPGFSTTAVLTLALGIGACASIFSVVNSVLLRPLPFPDSGQLVVLQESKLPQFPEFSVAIGQYLDWQEQATSFVSLAAMREVSSDLAGMGEAVSVSVGQTTANIFSTFGVRPEFGRDFSAEENTPGRDKVVILSHEFWMRQLGGRPEILQQPLRIDGELFTVVGVMPRAFQINNPTDLFVPAPISPRDRQNHGYRSLGVIGRLKPSVTIEQARGEMAVIAGRLAKKYPQTNEGWGVKVTPLLDFRVSNVRGVLFALLGAVGFLLLIACANVANLLFARATVRDKEIALRGALGASRGRVIRQLLTESVLLALLGALVGIVVAQWSVGALVALAPDGLPRGKEISVDWFVLSLTCALTLIAGIASGLLPAFLATPVNRDGVPRQGGTRSGRHHARLRSALVVSEIALSFMLLVGAGMFIRNFARLQSIDVGFQPRNGLAVNLALLKRKYATGPQRSAFAEQVVSRLAGLPGVRAAGAVQVLPFSPGLDCWYDVTIEGVPATATPPSPNYYTVTADYFKAMGIPLVRGRFFTADDVSNAYPVTIINSAMARQFFPGQDPIGRRIQFGYSSELKWREIVGVVGNVKFDRPDGDLPPQAYEPFIQNPFPLATFVVRTDGDASGLPTAIRAAIHDVDKEQPISSIRPLTEIVAQSLTRQRFGMFVLTVFSIAALLLAAVGIYGVVSYSVAQRTGEIGIRMALGAEARQVLRLVLFQSGRLITLGIGAGVVGASLLTRLLAPVLFDVGAPDPVTFGAIALLLSVIAAFACLLPARRATKIDPMTALRAE